MKLKTFLFSTVIVGFVSSLSGATVYFLEGDVGDISIVGGRPVSSTGRQFAEFDRFENTDEKGKVTGVTTANLIVLKDAITRSVKVPNWDVGISGNVTINGETTCKNLIMGILGRLLRE